MVNSVVNMVRGLCRYSRNGSGDRGVAPHTNCDSREGVFPKGWGGGRGESVLCALFNVVSGGECNCVREQA